MSRGPITPAEFELLREILESLVIKHLLKLEVKK